MPLSETSRTEIVSKRQSRNTTDAKARSLGTGLQKVRITGQASRSSDGLPVSSCS